MKPEDDCVDLFLRSESSWVKLTPWILIWVFLFWSELEFVKLVKGKSDHWYDYIIYQ